MVRKNTLCAPHCGNHPCALQVEIENGTPVKLRTHPKMRFPPCIKGFQLIDRLNHPDRILFPMKRTGKRGAGKWSRISWEEALGLVAEGLERAKSNYGNRSVALYNYAGQHGLPGGSRAAKFTIHRLLNLWGGFVPAVERGDLCWGAYLAATEALYGSWHVSLPSDEDCETVIVWGTNPLETGVRGPAQSLKQARKKGTKIVFVDPVRSLSVQKLGDLHLAVRPGTDIPLALSMLNEIFINRWDDGAFLVRYTNAPFLVREDTNRFLREKDVMKGGSDAPMICDVSGCMHPVFPGQELPAALKIALEASGTYKGIAYRTGYLRFREAAAFWPVEKAAAVCGVSDVLIRETAALFGKSKQAKVKVSQGGYQRNRGGEAAVQAISLLNIVTGRIRGMTTPGGLGPLTRAEDPIGTRRFYSLGISDTAMRYAVPNPVKDRFPVNRLAEAVLNAEAYGTDLHALLVMWGNPVSQNPDGQKTIQALKALDFVAVSDLFMTPTAKYADVFLPVSSFLERSSIIEGGEVAPTHINDLRHFNPQRQLFFARRSVEPRGESRDDFEIICDLARRMGYAKEFPWGTSDEWIEEIVDLARNDPRFPWLGGVTMECLDRDGIVNMPLPPLEDTWKMDTPSGKIELYSEQVILRGSSSLPEWPEDGEAFERLPLEQKKLHKDSPPFPLILVSPKSIFRSHSTFSNHEKLQRLGYNRAWMNPDDALSRGIENGDRIRLFNDRGETEIEVEVTENTSLGTVRIHSGGSPELGAANFLTPDRPTGYSEGAAFNDCRIQAEKILVSN